jgi:hypothetical protein
MKKIYFLMMKILIMVNFFFFIKILKKKEKKIKKLKEEEENKYKKIIEIIENSNDELFHYILYNWFLKNDLKNELLNFKFIYLKNYLIMNKLYDILWKYFYKYKKYEKSINILIYLSNIDDESIDLNQRIIYLKKSLEI